MPTDSTTRNHFIDDDKATDTKEKLGGSIRSTKYCGSIKSRIQTAASEFFNDCIEVNNQVVENSKLVDGFLLSDCISVKPNMATFSDLGKVLNL